MTVNGATSSHYPRRHPEQKQNKNKYNLWEVMVVKQFGQLGRLSERTSRLSAHSKRHSLQQYTPLLEADVASHASIECGKWHGKH